MKRLIFTLLTILCYTASHAQVAAITGPSNFCVGTTVTYSDATPGGVWSSSNPAIAVIGSVSGLATGTVIGVVVFSYTTGTGSATYSVTVDAVPGGITGGSTLCVGSPLTLSSSPVGGTWSSSSGVATISSGGVITGVTAGTTVITYSVATGCMTTIVVTVGPTPIPFTVTGGGNYCFGGSGVTISLSGSQPGATYQLYNGPAAVGAPVSGTGSAITFGPVTPAGTYNVVASTGSSCSLSMPGSATVVIDPLPNAYSVTGGGSYCAGGSGVPVGLAFSDLGISYQLYAAGVPVGAPVGGTNASLSFGMQTAVGTYSVVAADAVTGCINTMSGSVTVSIAPSPTSYTVSGGGNYCAGGPGVDISLANSDIGVLYMLYNGATPVGAAVSGTGSLIDFGFYTAGTYTIVANTGTSCSLAMSGSATVIVNPLPNVYTLTGGGSYCSGGSGLTVLLSGSDAGVSYQLYSGVSAWGLPVAGSGSSISFGTMTAAGTYAVSATDATTGCASSMTGIATIVVNPLPTVHTVTGGGTSCSGSLVSIGLSSSATGVNYQLYNGVTIVGSAVAGTGSVLSFGSYSAAGTYTVTATDASTSCQSAMSGSAVIITGAATITASVTTACGGVNTLTASGGVSYSWAPTTGLSCGGCSTPTITPTVSVVYTVTGTDASGCTGTATVAVDGNSISGAITYTGGSTSDVFKVWLIQYDPTDSSIVATDSMTTCMVGGAVAPYYQFMDPAAGSYMVKAALLGTTPGASGYIPTYSSSTPNWYSAASVTHSTGADALPITMVYGTVPSGPGFISGYVYAGAGKGTTGDAPDPGMTIYLKNASTGQVLTYTQTDAAGHFSFGSLNYGSYAIYPEAYKYYTTPSTMINISTSNTSVSNINFRKSTTFGTITPKPEAIQPIPELSYYIAPNPTSGDVSVTWPVVTGDAVINVTDLTGRTVYNEVLSATTGKAAVSLGKLRDGIYFIAVKTDNYNYGTKLLIQK